jgi:hypothetical protein
MVAAANAEREQSASGFIDAFGKLLPRQAKVQLRKDEPVAICAAGRGRRQSLADR